MTPPYDLAAVQARHDAVERRLPAWGEERDEWTQRLEEGRDLVRAHADRAALLALVREMRERMLTIMSLRTDAAAMRRYAEEAYVLATDTVTPAGPAREGAHG